MLPFQFCVQRCVGGHFDQFADAGGYDRPRPSTLVMHRGGFWLNVENVSQPGIAPSSTYRRRTRGAASASM